MYVEVQVCVQDTLTVEEVTKLEESLGQNLEAQ